MPAASGFDAVRLFEHRRDLWRTALKLLATASFLVPTHPRAEPVSIRCKTKSEFGTIIVRVDEERRTLVIEAPYYWGHPRWAFRQGAQAPSLVAGPDWLLGTETVEQIVIVAPAVIMAGWRNTAGELQHIASFNRAALRSKSVCRWHSFWDFKLARLRGKEAGSRG